MDVRGAFLAIDWADLLFWHLERLRRHEIIPVCAEYDLRTGTLAGQRIMLYELWESDSYIKVAHGGDRLTLETSLFHVPYDHRCLSDVRLKIVATCQGN